MARYHQLLFSELWAAVSRLLSGFGRVENKLTTEGTEDRFAEEYDGFCNYSERSTLIGFIDIALRAGK